MSTESIPLRIKQLPSGYWHIRGNGPEEWAQPANWPCSERELRAACGLGASHKFIQQCIEAMRKEPQA